MTATRTVEVTSIRRQSARKVALVSLWLFKHWVLVFSVLYGVVMVLPFLAPVFMHWGWSGLGQNIYSIYSLLCHQMAQRCFFLFGSHPMYNASELPIAFTGNMATDMLALRNFAGNPDMGWKVAWSDRMVYMYGAVWLAGIGYGILRRHHRIKPLHLMSFCLLLVPMAIDGGSHWLSDASSGLASGFRYDNQWLANLTQHGLPDWFYFGDAFGSFNSWMRLATGVLFGIACVWLAFPHIDRSMRESATILSGKLSHAALRDKVAA